MAKVVRDGRLYEQAPKKRKGKDLAGPISSQYDMTKDVSMERPKGWHEHYDVPNEKKGKVYREYLNSPGKTKGRGNMTGIKDETTTRGNGKTTKVNLTSKKKKMLNKLAK